MTAGHIRQCGKSSWELKFDASRDPATGKRKIQYVSFHGTKREAQVKLADLLSAVGKRVYVEASKVTVAEHVRSRVDQWQAAGDISVRTAERYRQLIDHQIEPYLGVAPVQKLTTVDIESWHSALRPKVSARTISHAHRILSHALRDGLRHGLVIKNVASIEGAPRSPTPKCGWSPRSGSGSWSRSYAVARSMPGRLPACSPDCAAASS